MMLFFKPETKVQKDRKVMKDTDTRLAKYSRRGIILSLAAYLLCAAVGQMHIVAPRTTIVLTIGIVLLTLIRGFYAFRFESLYARAPAHWRNQYFIVTLLGSIWWSAIVSVFTVVLGFQHEVPLLWLYTIVFFSTMTQSISPYKQFSQAYIFIGLFPPALAAIFTGEFEGYMYAVVMLVFLALLSHQASLINHNYWERLSSTFALQQKARTLEAEKRDTEANVELNHEFVANLGHELRTSLNDVMGGLALISHETLSSNQQEMVKLAEKSAARQLDLINNIMDFSRIINRQLALDSTSFNLRQQLDYWVRDAAHDAHQYAIELDYRFDEEAPLRVRGDAIRLGQVVNLILTNSIKLTDAKSILVDARLERLSDRHAQLQLSISNHSDFAGDVSQTDESSSTDSTDSTESSVPQAGRNSLWYTICKGLSECMSGELNYLLSRSGRHWEYWLQIPFEMTDSQNSEPPHDSNLKGKRVLLFAPNSLHRLGQELSEWGMSVTTVTQLGALESSIDKAGTDDPYDAIFYSSKGAEFAESLESLRRLLPISPSTPWILFLTYVEAQSEPIQSLIVQYPAVSVIARPFIREEFFSQFVQALQQPDQREKIEPVAASLDLQGVGKTVLLADDHKVNQMVTEGMLKKLGYAVVIANNGAEAVKLCMDQRPDLILMDCQMPEMDGFDATRRIRELEAADAEHDCHTPIIAMTAQAEATTETQCLAAGMDDYMAKPVTFETLELRLKRWAGESGEESES